MPRKQRRRAPVGHHLPSRARLKEPLVERGFGGGGTVSGGERVEMANSLSEALRGEPLAVGLHPHAPLVDTPAEQQQHVDSASGRGRTCSARQRSRPASPPSWARRRPSASRKQEAGEQFSVFAVALDPPAGCTRPFWDDHLHAHAGRLGCPVEREAGQPCLVARSQREGELLQQSNHLRRASVEAPLQLACGLSWRLATTEDDRDRLRAQRVDRTTRIDRRQRGVQADGGSPRPLHRRY